MCLAWAYHGAGQPVWVDELHSSWVLSAPDWQQLSARAAMGNQSPYYFYLIALLGWTVEFPPASPWVMRLPSMLAWSLSVGLCVWHVLSFRTCRQPECVSTRFLFSARSLRQPDANAFRLIGQLICVRLPTACGIYLPVILWTACIALDRNQGFYAVEARVYGLLQLLSLLAWLTVGRLVSLTPHPLTLPSPPQSLGRGDLDSATLATTPQSRGRGDRSGQIKFDEVLAPSPPTGVAQFNMESGIAKNATPDGGEGWGEGVYPVPRSNPEFLSDKNLRNDVPASQGTQIAFCNRLFLWLAWCLLCTCLVHLHVTSCLAVATQGILLLVVFCRHKDRGYLLLSLVWIAIQLMLALSSLQPVWQRREQWAAFAGDASLPSMLQILTLIPLLLPVLVVGMIQRAANKLRQDANSAGRAKANELPNEPDLPPLVISRPWFWALAWAGPWLMAALITQLEIAPVFHYRFIIGSALPLFLFLACVLQRLTSASLRILAISAILFGLLWTQGSLSVWRQGGSYLGFRGEDWAGAVRYVSDRFQVDQDVLWCYAGLIEGHNMQCPLTVHQDEYLSFPLRGWYQVASPGAKPVQPHGLTGQFSTWMDQIRARPGSRDTVWIVFRGTAKQLEQRLRQAGLDLAARRHPITQFGRVSVVCIDYNASPKRDLERSPTS